MTEKEIRDLFASKNVALGRDDVWKVQNSLVIKHSALERLAGAIKVRWNPPQVLRADRDEAVILATGYVIYSDGLVGTEEWSIGEALVGVNYRVSGKQAAYVYAMAEKRAKDRVILKLANLHGAYSEDEADEFKEQRNVTEEPAPERLPREANASDKTTAATLISALRMAKSEIDLKVWGQQNRATIESLPDSLKDAVRLAFAEHLDTLRRQKAA